MTLGVVLVLRASHVVVGGDGRAFDVLPERGVGVLDEVLGADRVVVVAKDVLGVDIADAAQIEEELFALGADVLGAGVAAGVEPYQVLSWASYGAKSMGRVNRTSGSR